MSSSLEAGTVDNIKEFSNAVWRVLGRGRIWTYHLWCVSEYVVDLLSAFLIVYQWGANETGSVRGHWNGQSGWKWFSYLVTRLLLHVMTDSPLCSSQFLSTLESRSLLGDGGKSQFTHWEQAWASSRLVWVWIASSVIAWLAWLSVVGCGWWAQTRTGLSLKRDLMDVV